MKHFDFPSALFDQDLFVFTRMAETDDTIIRDKTDTYISSGQLVADTRLVGFLRDMARAVMQGRDVTFARVIDETPTPLQRYIIRSFDIPAEALGAQCVYMERGNFLTMLRNEFGGHDAGHDFHLLDKARLVSHDPAIQVEENASYYTLLRQNILIDAFGLDALLDAHPGL